jgi:hypothetical protein
VIACDRSTTAQDRPADPGLDGHLAEPSV